MSDTLAARNSDLERIVQLNTLKDISSAITGGISSKGPRWLQDGEAN